MSARSLKQRLSWITRYPARTCSGKSGFASKQRADVAILGGRGYHSSYGGVENAIREIANHTVTRRKLNLIIYGTDPSEVNGSSFENAELSFVYPPSPVYQHLGQHGAVFSCVMHIICLSRPKAVIVFASGPCVFVPLLRLFGIPVISSLRAVDSARDKWGLLSRKILQLGEYFAWKFASKFTANSVEMIRIFGAMRTNAIFIPNGSSSARDGDSRIMLEHGLSSNNYLLFAARLDPAKRLHLLLQAHSQLDQSERLPLVIAGGHSKSVEYQQRLSSYAGPDVIFLGHLSAELLEPLMCHCRAFLLPSVLEGMSNSLLSAMASGRAVLASDIAPNADVLENPEALFQADNMDALRKAILRLCRDSDFAAKLGASLQRHAQQNYSWQRTADLFYEELQPYLGTAGFVAAADKVPTAGNTATTSRDEKELD